MTQSTEVAVRKTPIAEAVLTRRIEAHAVSADSNVSMAAAVAAVYALTEGMALHPLGYWMLHPSGQASVSGALEAMYGVPVHEQRQRLQEWADAFEVEVIESRSYSNQVKLTATRLFGGVPVSVHVEVNHDCQCTGQCRGDDL